MKKRQRWTGILGIVCAAALLGGCGTDGAKEAETDTAAATEAETDAATAPEAETDMGANGTDASETEESTSTEDLLVIEKTDITGQASFIDYDADGVTVQLLAIADADGNVHVAYNTCQSCSPSPMAYFVQQGDALICQNCGNSFTAEDVGTSAAGCNPMMIENLTETDTELIVPTAELESMRDRFEKWKG